MEEQHVRVTIKGPVLATLILTGWLELQGAPRAQAAEDHEVVGTMDVFTETAEYWLDLPCALVYDIAAEPGVRHSTIERSDTLNARSNGTRPPAFLLRLVVAGP